MVQMTLPMVLIPYEVENNLINQRAIDGYVNATAMCRVAGKQLGHYLENKTTREFLVELSSDIGIPIAELVQIVMGGVADGQGTWVHPDVAIHLGQWCSPKFAVQVSRWVREWATGKFKPASLPYHIQRYIANRSEIPPTHFSMLNEMIFALIAPLESAGYTLPDDMVPDISSGRMFCKWLREEKGVDTDSLPTYCHRFDDGRIVYPKLYPNEFLADFRKHFNEVWLPTKCGKYFKDRDPKALPYFPKALPMVPAVE